MDTDLQRKIIHCDCDCFFAAVEIRDDPLLQGKPVAVGGQSDRRGVIATCNYEARRFGIRSAMATAHAKRLCPDLILVPPNFEKYKTVSSQIREVFEQYTDLIEPLSLDEAFLDVTGKDLCGGSATYMAREIKQKVNEVTGITISAGVAPNKFLAKIASDWQKPDGLFVITPEEVDGFVEHLPLNKIFGVGKSMNAKLEKLGLKNCADVREKTIFELVEQFGKMGKRLHELSYGIDNRPVNVERNRKSISVERTFAVDLLAEKEIVAQVEELLEKLLPRLEKAGAEHYLNNKIECPKGVFVKVKFNDFTSTTVDRGGEVLCLETLKELMHEGWSRKKLPVRLLGVGLRLPEGGEDGQLLLGEF